MPIYEYDCADCRRRVSLLVLRTSSAPPPSVSRAAAARPDPADVTLRHRQDRGRPAGVARRFRRSFGDLDENDPASVARFMKKMGKEFGDDLGDDFESAVDEAMAESDGEGGGAEPGDDRRIRRRRRRIRTLSP